MEPSPEILEKFRKKAEAASAIVSEVDSMAQTAILSTPDYRVHLYGDRNGLQACSPMLRGLNCILESPIISMEPGSNRA